MKITQINVERTVAGFPEDFYEQALRTVQYPSLPPLAMLLNFDPKQYIAWYQENFYIPFSDTSGGRAGTHMQLSASALFPQLNESAVFELRTPTGTVVTVEILRDRTVSNVKVEFPRNQTVWAAGEVLRQCNFLWQDEENGYTYQEVHSALQIQGIEGFNEDNLISYAEFNVLTVVENEDGIEEWCTPAEVEEIENRPTYNTITLIRASCGDSHGYHVIADPYWNDPRPWLECVRGDGQCYSGVVKTLHRDPYETDFSFWERAQRTADQWEKYQESLRTDKHE